MLDLHHRDMSIYYVPREVDRRDIHGQPPPDLHDYDVATEILPSLPARFHLGTTGVLLLESGKIISFGVNIGGNSYSGRRPYIRGSPSDT